MIAKVDDKDAYVVIVSSKLGSAIKEYFDVNTGFKLKKVTTTSAGPSSTTYSDYKEINGIKFPYSETISSQVEIPLKVTDVKINSGLKDDDFK
jgi:zinc protease